jgi:hypothetical protein
MSEFNGAGPDDFLYDGLSVPRPARVVGDRAGLHTPAEATEGGGFDPIVGVTRGRYVDWEVE